MTTDATKWINLTDFRPGIKQRTGFGGNAGYVNTTSSPAEGPGIASPNATYRCISLPQGGLGPLPKSTQTFSRTSPPATTHFLTGFRLLGPAFQPSAAFAATGGGQRDAIFASTFSCSFIVGYTYASGGTERVRVERWPVFRSTSTFDVIRTDVPGNTTQAKANPIWMASGRSTTSAVDPTIIGSPIVAWGWVADDKAAGAILTTFYPDPRVPDSGVAVTPAALAGARVVAHQNRFVTFNSSAWMQSIAGTNDATSNNEAVQFSSPNDIYGAVSSASSLYGSEDPSNIGVASSLSASDLLIIRHSYGGYLVQGDVSNPTVRRLPGVMSTYGTECIGAKSPIGYVYGANGSGVYAWQGNDASVHLSPDMEPDFWQTSDSVTNINRFRGQFGTFRDWVLVPNNWIYDTTGQSWWRLENPATVQLYMYNTDPINPVFYAAKSVFTSSSTAAIYAFDGTTATDTYSWQSHPMYVGIDRMVDVKELILRVKSMAGGGTVTVTLTGRAGTTTVSSVNTFTYTASSGEHQTFRVSSGPFTSEFIRVTIAANATSSSDPAPIIDGLHIGYEDTTLLART